MLFLSVLIAIVTVVAAFFYAPAEPPPAKEDDVEGNKRHFNKACVLSTSDHSHICMSILYV